jgi:hypothetical protein
MDPEETNQPIANQPDELAETPIESADAVQPDRPLNRRRFLTAAVLGTAAAAFLNKGSGRALHLGPASAFAHDISDFQCTANDVRIQGPGRILNEPCDCTGTFSATVEFTVINNASSDRNCITLHLCPVMINGVLFNPGDVVLQGTVGPKATAPMTATIQNYPCGAGLVCFGSQPAAGQGEVFAKGEDCPSGQCCSTITWRVPGQDPDCGVAVKLIGSKCRHQQICIQGRGSTTLDCNTSQTGVQTNCAAPCGGTTTLRLCTTGGPAPYTFSLSAPGQTTQTRTSSNLCEDFTVTVSDTTTFTGTITDSGSPPCSDSAQVTLTVTPVSITVSATPPDCAGGNTVITVLPAGLANYQFSIDGGASIDNGTSNVLSTVLAPGTHSITASATNSAGCSASASTSVTVPTAVTLSDITRSAGCDGVVTLSATASDGTPGYTFTWKVNGVVQTSGISSSNGGATSTLTLQPLLNGVCRTVEVSVVDSKGCGPSAKTNRFSQCVTTTACP